MLKIIFHTFNFVFLVLYLFPGSLIGLFIYKNIFKQPQLTTDFLSISSNHVYAFACLTLLGFFCINKKKKLVFYLVFICFFLEICHLFIPNRSFQFSDLFGNVLGVIIPLAIITIYNYIDKMSSFEDRKKSFEKKFAHDEEMQFKVSAKRNKYIGEWVSNLLGYDNKQQLQYIQDVIKSDFAEAGDGDVFKKIKEDLKSKNMSDEEIRKKMDELNEKAKSDFK